MESSFNIAIVGASGAVGREMAKTLAERNFPASKVKALASERSIGTSIDYGNKKIDCEVLTPDSFEGVDIALFSAGGGVSKEYSPIAAKAGAIVIDNSSAFRMEENVPLVVPEVNAHVLDEKLSQGKGEGFIIANPNCSTIQLVVFLKPIHENYGLKRVVVSTYQSVSGAGQKGMDELSKQAISLLAGEEFSPKAFDHQIAFNCIPHIDVFLDNDYTKEEMKIVWESRKIMSLPELRITTTAVRVPAFACHGESVNMELERPATAKEIKHLISNSDGLTLLDDPSKLLYPMGVDCVNTDDVYVGRVREDESNPNTFNAWVVADNLRKGAALNSVQIAEYVASKL